MNQYERNVKKGIRSALNLANPGMSLTSNALRLISVLMMNLNERLVDQCKKQTVRKRKSKAIMLVTVPHKVVRNVFDGRMRICAEAAAHKCITKYNMGILIYTPRKKVKKITKKMGKITPVHTFSEFMKGIPVVAEMISPDIVLPIGTKKMMAGILQSMTTTIVQKSREISKGQGTVKSGDIVKAVDYCMASVMSKHAISEGARNTLLFTNGCNSKYRVEDFLKLRKRKLQK